jgi:hypothetical protein
VLVAGWADFKLELGAEWLLDGLCDGMAEVHVVLYEVVL